MEGHQGGGPGYDDWFDEPEQPTETQGSANRGVYEDVEDQWMLPEDEESHRSSQREIVVAGRTLTLTQVAIIVLSVLAIFFAILAAAGVFDSGKAAAPPVTPPPTHPVTTQQTTTQTNTTSSVQAPSTTLKPGDTGQQVKLLQQSLGSLDFSVGTVDGDYGPATQVAVEKFQVAKGLAEDGIVGPATLAALQKAVANQ